MAERWPGCMLVTTAAEYLDTKPHQVEKLLREGELGAVQYNDRGDRRILKEELDAYLNRLRQRSISA